MHDLTQITLPSFLSGDNFLQLAGVVVDQGSSEITLQSNRPVFITLHGQLIKLTPRNIMDYEVRAVAKFLYGANIDSEVGRKGEIDFAYHCHQNGHHFRVNITKCHDGQSGGIQISMRVIPHNPKPLPEHHLEDKLAKSLRDPEGLVLVTGATGSGKSTLIASVIAHLSQVKNLKILTYESPIEFIFDDCNGQSIISQTEVPRDLSSFSQGVRNALRRTPDIIMVGEVRDKETLDAVMEAALTGHTVMTTLHSKGVVDAIRRMLVMFPSEQRQARMYDLIQLMDTVVWQKLVPGIDGQLVALREYIVFDDALRQKLVDMQLPDIDKTLKASFLTHGQSFYKSALSAYQKNKISKETYNSLCPESSNAQVSKAESGLLFKSHNSSNQEALLSTKAGCAT
ncbi:type IV pilus twitching motility protein PilT [Facilibium subflavum]|uniref:type IV pilus twitching motility protein PilT n=1 Tax=Facilibium subflavum TaxID=2219058 RepID=UPI000E65E11A|nr:ATPase, T2SS/T4P/T4SS family [Facilibium subflavum]